MAWIVTEFGSFRVVHGCRCWAGVPPAGPVVRPVADVSPLESYFGTIRVSRESERDNKTPSLLTSDPSRSKSADLSATGRREASTPRYEQRVSGT
jgi:hypothetical protein